MRKLLLFVLLVAVVSAFGQTRTKDGGSLGIQQRINEVNQTAYWQLDSTKQSLKLILQQIDTLLKMNKAILDKYYIPKQNAIRYIDTAVNLQ